MKHSILNTNLLILYKIAKRYYTHCCTLSFKGTRKSTKGKLLLGEQPITMSAIMYSSEIFLWKQSYMVIVLLSTNIHQSQTRR